MLKKHYQLTKEKVIKEKFSIQIIPLYDDIYRYLLHLGCDRFLSEDLSQEVMLTAWTHREQLIDSAYQKPWLLTVAHNNYMSFRRLVYHKYEYTDFDITMTEIECKQAETDILSLLVTKESFEQLNTALERLDSKYSEPIRLRYFGDLSHQEIAELLNMKPGTIRSIISRGLQKLRAIINNFDF